MRFCRLAVQTLYALACVISLSSMSYAETGTNSLSRITQNGAEVFLDGSLHVTGASQADKWFEEVDASTPTTPATNHARTFLNNTLKEICTIYDNGAVGCIQTTPITSLVAGYGLSGGGSSGSLTINLLSNVSSYIQNTSSLQSGATFYISSGTVVNTLVVGNIVQGQPWGDIRSFGAIADGVTDNASFINNAVATSSAVFIPCGTFLVGSPINIANKAYFSMTGAGDCSILKQKASTIITIVTVSTSTDIRIADFQIDGNTGNQNGAGGSGAVLIQGASSRVVLDNLTIHDTDGNAISFKNNYDPSTAYDNVIEHCHINELSTNSAGIKILNPQNSMRISDNHVYTGGNGEAAQVELSSAVITNNVFVASNSIALTLNGGQSYGEHGSDLVVGNQFYGADIGLELGNYDGQTTVTGNHIEQSWRFSGAAQAVAFTNSGISVSSNVVFTGNVIVASMTLVQFGNRPVQTSWMGNYFRRSMPINNSDWFTNGPARATFIGNFFDGEDMKGSYNMFNFQMSQDAVIGNVFNCGPGTTSNAIQLSSLGSSLGSTFFGNQFTNCTNNFAGGGFDYQIGDEVKSYAAPVNCTNNAWGDATNIALTVGVWSISSVGTITLNGAIGTQFIMGISTHSGTSSTGLSQGDNWVNQNPPTSTTDSTVTIPSYVQTVPAGGATYYLKMQCVTSAGTMQFDGVRLSAIKLQ